jgi:hypothetical protein
MPGTDSLGLVLISLGQMNSGIRAAVTCGWTCETLREVDLVGDAALLHVREEIGLRGETVRELRGADQADGRKLSLGALMVEQGHAELLQVALTCRPSGRLTGRLDGRQQEPDERADDGDDDEQFDQREGSLRTPGYSGEAR